MGCLSGVDHPQPEYALRVYALSHNARMQCQQFNLCALFACVRSEQFVEPCRWVFIYKVGFVCLCECVCIAREHYTHTHTHSTHLATWPASIRRFGSYFGKNIGYACAYRTRQGTRLCVCTFPSKQSGSCALTTRRRTGTHRISQK